MPTENICFYLQNRLMQTSQRGGQWYSDTSLFSIPWTNSLSFYDAELIGFCPPPDGAVNLGKKMLRFFT